MVSWENLVKRMWFRDKRISREEGLKSQEKEMPKDRDAKRKRRQRKAAEKTSVSRTSDGIRTTLSGEKSVWQVSDPRDVNRRNCQDSEMTSANQIKRNWHRQKRMPGERSVKEKEPQKLTQWTAATTSRSGCVPIGFPFSLKASPPFETSVTPLAWALLAPVYIVFVGRVSGALCWISAVPKVSSVSAPVYPSQQENPDAQSSDMVTRASASSASTVSSVSSASVVSSTWLNQIESILTRAECRTSGLMRVLLWVFFALLRVALPFFFGSLHLGVKLWSVGCMSCGLWKSPA